MGFLMEEQSQGQLLVVDWVSKASTPAFSALEGCVKVHLTSLQPALQLQCTHRVSLAFSEFQRAFKTLEDASVIQRGSSS